MRPHVYSMGVVTAALLLSASAAAKPNHERDPMASLKVGQWIQLRGELSRERPGVCMEVEPLAGDFVDDDWDLTGRIVSVDRVKHTFTIFNVVVQVAPNTHYEGPKNSLTNFAGIHPGMIVEADGTFTRDGFYAKEVDDETDELGRREDKERRVQMTARVERLDIARRRITVMGMTFVWNEKTQFKSMIR